MFQEFEENLKEYDEDLVDRALLLNEDDDHSTVHLEVHAGVGGAEAQLFAFELLEMYTKYMAYKGWEIGSIDMSGGTHDGARKVQNATVTVSGPNSYQTLKLEAGVHRVQRIPATESGGRIHTSTVTVAAIPQPDDVGTKLLYAYMFFHIYNVIFLFRSRRDCAKFKGLED